MIYLICLAGARRSGREKPAENGSNTDGIIDCASVWLSMNKTFFSFEAAAAATKACSLEAEVEVGVEFEAEAEFESKATK